MWILAGLWHNLLLPLVDKNAEAHHEGLVIMLIAYFILAFLMVYLFEISNKNNNYLLEGIRVGGVVGILWVFPHGLAMAGAHNTSILYEIQNVIWHIVEQGLGGIVIGFVYKKLQREEVRFKT